jgi:ribosomal protein S18 acetylase RimI-like enzyme
MAEMIDIAKGQDGDGILRVTSHIDVFTDEEKDCVAELWDEYVRLGTKASGYTFLVAFDGAQVSGFACYGERPLTKGTYDLYWIAIDPFARRKGAGRELLQRVEAEIQKMGGRLVFVETSGLEKYEATRCFYLATGYLLEATVKDFYSEGDDLVIFTKHL